MGVDLDVTTVLAGVLVFSIFLYVVMDGFDLGLAMLFPAMHPEDRDTMIDTIAPVWDGNETWLVLGGGGLLAGFPAAYGLLMPALYVPVVVMLLGLVFRGVAFEFRVRAPENHRRLWNAGFWLGSTAAALMQGIALGTVLQGVRAEGGAYAGGWFDWLTPFTILTGLSVCAAYILLGACWLILKTQGRLRDQAYALARPMALVVLFAIAAVSVATPFLQGDYWRRWFTWPTMLLAAPVPLLLAGLAVLLLRALAARADRWPLLLALGIFALCFAGLGVSMYPWIVPGVMTIHDAAAPESSQKFYLAGVIMLIPVILVYTAYTYWVFRGKVSAGAGYH